MRTMTVTEGLKQSYLLATGKLVDLAVTDTKGAKLLALMNMFTQKWALEPSVDWASLKSTFTLAATVSATNTYALPATVGKLSDTEGDYVRITVGTSEYDYTIVPAERLYDAPKLDHYDNFKCAVVGSSLVFAHTFTADDPQFGGTITASGYSIPATMTAGTDVIAVDDPNWLITIAAADFCRTDITRVQYYPGLKDEADMLMAGMKQRNNSQMETVARDWNPVPSSGGAFE